MTYSGSSDRNNRIAELRRRSAERRAADPQVGDVVDISEELAFEDSLTDGTTPLAYDGRTFGQNTVRRLASGSILPPLPFG